MLLIPAEDRQRRPRAVPDRVLLRCDDKGCTLAASGSERRFPDLPAALDCACLSRDATAATIEVWQDGQYICCVTPKAWRHGDADFPSFTAPRLVPHSMLIAAERHANRVARVMLATAGPLFWLALLAVMVAASLGWRLLF